MSESKMSESTTFEAFQIAAREYVIRKRDEPLQPPTLEGTSSRPTEDMRVVAYSLAIHSNLWQLHESEEDTEARAESIAVGMAYAASLIDAGDADMLGIVMS